jgi:peptidoglycan hydrolase CwlO-like protein
LRRTKQNYNNSPDDIERLEADIETAEQEVEVLEHDMRMRETMMTKLRIEWDWLSDRARMSRER